MRHVIMALILSVLLVGCNRTTSSGRPLADIMSEFVPEGAEVLQQPEHAVDPCTSSTPMVFSVGGEAQGRFTSTIGQVEEFAYPAVEGTYVRVASIEDKNGVIHVLAVRIRPTGE